MTPRISRQLREGVAAHARYRCGYCLTAETIVGTPIRGRATVVALSLNRHLLVVAQRAWISAGWHPPQD